MSTQPQQGGSVASEENRPLPRKLASTEEFAPALTAYLKNIDHNLDKVQQMDTVIAGKIHVDIMVTPIKGLHVEPVKNMVMAVTRTVEDLLAERDAFRAQQAKKAASKSDGPATKSAVQDPKHSISRPKAHGGRGGPKPKKNESEDDADFGLEDLQKELDKIVKGGDDYVVIG